MCLDWLIWLIFWKFLLQFNVLTTMNFYIPFVWLWPSMMSQVSQLLAVLYTLSPSNEAFYMLSSSSSLSESQWASYFHQASLGTHLNYQLFSRLGKQKDENTMHVDVSTMNNDCFSCTFNAIIKCLYVGALCISYIISCLLSIWFTLVAKFGYLIWTSSYEFNWWYLLFNLNNTNLSFLKYCYYNFWCLRETSMTRVNST